jgi:hypothetical protein
MYGGNGILMNRRKPAINVNAVLAPSKNGPVVLGELVQNLQGPDQKLGIYHAS